MYVHLSRASANILLSRLLSIQRHKSSCFDSEIDRRQAEKGQARKAGRERAGEVREATPVHGSGPHTPRHTDTQGEPDGGTLTRLLLPLTLTETNHCCANKKSTAWVHCSRTDVLLCPPVHVFPRFVPN